MRLSDFDYRLPKELIAQYPLKDRDRARMLVVHRASGKIEHRTFQDITEYLRKDDLLALNDTRVVSCRLLGNRATGGKAEVFLLKEKGGLVFEALLKPGRLKAGETIAFAGSTVTCEITGKHEARFRAKNTEEVYALGTVPLPPYIKREAEASDAEDYQTVYARENGSVASPTAGLHFTEALLEKIRKGGTEICFLTLHVGLATFKPVSCEDITKHPMGKEYCIIPDGAAAALADARTRNGRVIAVGTTACRSLETYASGVREGYTDLFIYPGYEFKLVDCLLTNFHLPKTTLFMLVCAFAGTALAHKAYAEAIKEHYRFYSYGDAMLII